MHKEGVLCRNAVFDDTAQECKPDPLLQAPGSDRCGDRMCMSYQQSLSQMCMTQLRENAVHSICSPCQLEST